MENPRSRERNLEGLSGEGERGCVEDKGVEEGGFSTMGVPAGDGPGFVSWNSSSEELLEGVGEFGSSERGSAALNRPDASVYNDFWL